MKRIKKEISSIKTSRISKLDKELMNPLINFASDNEDMQCIQYLKAKETEIIDFFDRYHYHKITRYVDFNQGLDARLLKEPEAQQLSKLAIRPCRIAFDDLNTRKYYFEAMDAAVKSGIKYFSNYLLYNYKDKPDDLWLRLYLNI